MNINYKSGFTLMEVLISGVIFSIILLSTEGVLLSVMHRNESALLITKVAIQLNNLKERLKASQNNPIQKQELVAWQQENKIILPEAVTEISGRSVRIVSKRLPHSIEMNML